MSPSPRQLWQQLARTSWLFFPFTSASPNDKDTHAQRSRDHIPQRAAGNTRSGTGTGTGTGTGNSASEASSDPDWSPRIPRIPPVELGLDNDAVIVLAFLLGSATTLGASIVYRRFFKRIRNAEYITPDLLKRKRWVTGVVTRCVLTVVFPNQYLIQITITPKSWHWPPRTHAFIHPSNGIHSFMYLVRTAWVTRIISAFITRRVLAGAVYSSSDMCRLSPSEVRDYFAYPTPTKYDSKPITMNPPLQKKKRCRTDKRDDSHPPGGHGRSRSE